jgi:hypothetical protein
MPYGGRYCFNVGALERQDQTRTRELMALARVCKRTSLHIRWGGIDEAKI